jgi:hypothetical protein
MVTHRLVKRSICQDKVQWVTRGDRVRRNDVPLSSHELLGRVMAIKRGSRWLTSHQSIAGRLASWILSRSDLATRVVVRLRRQCVGLGIREQRFEKGNE